MIPIQSNILNRVFFIKAAQYGTAFTIDVKGVEYLVTTKHLFDQSAENLNIHLFQNNQWTPQKTSIIKYCGGNIDIAVLCLEKQLTPPNLPIEPSIAKLALGQDVYILGFPHKMHEDVGQALGGNPCPLIKRGTAANLGTGDPQVLFVDTLSNEGFSGGPVVFLPLGSTQGVQVAGVISGFNTYHEPVIGENGEPTGCSVEMNTGLLRAYGIKHAIDLIGRISQKN